MGTTLTHCPTCGHLSERGGRCRACSGEAWQEGAGDVRSAFTGLWADEGARWCGVLAGVAAGALLALLLSAATRGAAFRWIALEMACGRGKLALLWCSGPFWLFRGVVELQARVFRGALDLFEKEEFLVGSVVPLVLGEGIAITCWVTFPHSLSGNGGFTAWWLAPWLCQFVGIAAGVRIFRWLDARIL